jgi:hypothetical protein
MCVHCGRKINILSFFLWHKVHPKGEAVVTILEKKYSPSKQNYADICIFTSKKRL